MPALPRKVQTLPVLREWMMFPDRLAAPGCFTPPSRLMPTGCLGPMLSN